MGSETLPSACYILFNESSNVRRNINLRKVYGNEITIK